MKRGMAIGRFKSPGGEWGGEIQTLTVNRQACLVSNGDRASANAPAFRFMMGLQQIGDAWERQSRTGPVHHDLRVRIDDSMGWISVMLSPGPGAMAARSFLPPRKAWPEVHSGQEKRDV